MSQRVAYSRSRGIPPHQIDWPYSLSLVK
jgi:hypothetical protein